MSPLATLAVACVVPFFMMGLAWFYLEAFKASATGVWPSPAGTMMANGFGAAVFTIGCVVGEIYLMCSWWGVGGFAIAMAILAVWSVVFPKQRRAYVCYVRTCLDPSKKV